MGITFVPLNEIIDEILYYTVKTSLFRKILCYIDVM